MKSACLIDKKQHIRRPRPLPRQGRRLGPPEVWNLALGSQAKAHAIKATPLSATCPRHLPCSWRTLTPTCPRTFKTAVCPASNPPNASAGLQGNNSYSYYMPLPSVFQGVQDCRLPALKPPKRFQRSRRPPRQQLLQLLHAPAICFSGGSRLPFARPQTPQTLPTLPQASKATTLTATCPQTLQTLPTLSQASQALPSVFQGFKTAVCPPSNPPNASNAPAGLQGNNSYSYMSSNPPNASNPLAGLQGNNSYSYMPLPSVFQGVQDCRLPALKPPKRQRSRRPPRQQLLQLHVQRSRRPPRQQLLQLHAPAICFSGGSRLPFARPQTPQTLPTLPQASKATTLTATCPCHLFFRGFKTAVCPPSNPPNASNAPAGLQGNNSYSYMPLPSVFQGVQDCRRKHSYMPLPSVFQGVQDCRLPGLKPSKRFQPSRRPPRQQLLQLHAPAICFSGGSRLPFARPQTPQTLPTLPQASKATTLTATCPCHLFFRGSRLPSQAKAHATFARPQTLQTLPHASKATTLTATTCPCHLFFRGFKTAVCPPSNPPNASNAPAGLQGNNSYSYMPLPSVFHGVQDCRLPGLKRPKRF